VRGILAAAQGERQTSRRGAPPCAGKPGVEFAGRPGGSERHPTRYALELVNRAGDGPFSAQTHDEKRAIGAIRALVGKEPLKAAGVGTEKSLVRGSHIAMGADRVLDLFFVHGLTLARRV
jgi:hypothetical protein